jgi:large subunit ribosomal protein L5
MARLLEKYRNEIVPKMMERFSYTNRLACPRLEKIVVNMGVGEVTREAKQLDAVAQDLALITGQKALITRARGSVSGFKIRRGMNIGCKVTLRGARMYEFLDRLISVAIPRIRDFRGLNPDSFDQFGHYSLGIVEQTVFPEVSIDTIQFPQGMDITLVITRSTKEESFELLRLFGMPFRESAVAAR